MRFRNRGAKQKAPTLLALSPIQWIRELLIRRDNRLGIELKRQHLANIGIKEKL